MCAFFQQPTEVERAQFSQMWLQLALDMHVEDLLTLHASGVVPDDFLQTPVLAENVTVSPYSDIEVLVRFLQRINPNSVHALSVANCFMVAPVRLLECLPLLRNLVELDCIKCELNPGSLFSVIATSLPALTEIRWSILDYLCENTNMPGAALDRAQFVPSLRQMYVETSGASKGCLILCGVLTYCLNIERLHIHALRGSSVMANFCAFVIDAAVKLTEFAYTSDGNFYNEHCCPHLVSPICQFRHIDFRSIASVCGNVIFPKLPEVTCTCAYLADLIVKEEFEIPSDHLILCVEDRPESMQQLTQVAERPWWSCLLKLTVALLPGPETPNEHAIPEIGMACIEPLNKLLKASREITELNFTLCHFGSALDLRELVVSGSLLTALRAIALPQCALKSNLTTERLAYLCPRLEEIYVCRVSAWKSDTCSSCNSCFTALNRAVITMLTDNALLRRLTLCDVSPLKCLRFLKKSNLVQVRLSWRSMDAACCTPERIARLLSANTNLRLIALRPRNMDLMTLCTALCTVDLPCLHIMSIISDMPILRQSVEQAFSNLLTKHRRITTLHAHFCDEKHVERTVTWTYRKYSCQPPEHQLFLHGALIYDAPCRYCSFATFIGMAKPPYAVETLYLP